MGTELFGEIDKYVRGSGNLTNRFDYREEWNHLCDWLCTNSNPTIVQAYRTKNIEQLFTALDFAAQLHDDAFMNVVFAGKGTDAQMDTGANYDIFSEEIKHYQHHRKTLLWALEHYFDWRHNSDYGWTERPEWDTLRAFAQKLKAGDVVITFNYDATMERVLLDQGKWSLRDGYGFDLVFQKSRSDKAPVPLDKSSILILHLHGAIGWYRRPASLDTLPASAYGRGPGDCPRGSRRSAATSLRPHRARLPSSN